LQIKNPMKNPKSPRKRARRKLTIKADLLASFRFTNLHKVMAWARNTFKTHKAIPNHTSVCQLAMQRHSDEQTVLMKYSSSQSRSHNCLQHTLGKVSKGSEVSSQKVSMLGIWKTSHSENCGDKILFCNFLLDFEVGEIIGVLKDEVILICQMKK